MFQMTKIKIAICAVIVIFSILAIPVRATYHCDGNPLSIYAARLHAKL